MPSVTSPYVDPRAHAVRERYLSAFGGPEIPVPVESIAEDLLGLKIEEQRLDYSGMLLPADRTTVLNLAESARNDPPLRRHRFTIAHEIGHWVCHCLEGRAATLEPSYCRATDIANDVDWSRHVVSHPGAESVRLIKTASGLEQELNRRSSCTCGQ